MTNYYIRTLLHYFPQFTFGIITGILLYLAFLMGRGVALRHLIKHHLKEIAGDELTEALEENVRFRLNIERLKKDNELYLKTLAGIKYLVRKGE